MTCCTEHDGPHLHGCVRARYVDGGTHDGACRLAPEVNADLVDVARMRIDRATKSGNLTGAQVDEAVAILTGWYEVAALHGISPRDLAAVGPMPYTALDAVALRDRRRS